MCGRETLSRKVKINGREAIIINRDVYSVLSRYNHIDTYALCVCVYIRACEIDENK